MKTVTTTTPYRSGWCGVRPLSHPCPGRFGKTRCACDCHVRPVVTLLSGAVTNATGPAAGCGW